MAILEFSGRRTGSLAVLMAALALCAGLAQPVQAGDPALEYAAKANYLSRMTPFVDWPATAFDGPAAPFILCVAGRDPFGTMIDEAVRDQHVGDHPVAVVRLRMVAKGAACHLLFLGRTRLQTPHQMLAAVAGQPVLTVADQDLAADGAMVRFVKVDGRVRFEIDAAAAEAGGLTLSSKLLSLSASGKGGER